MGVGFRRMSWEDTSMPDAGILDAVIADRPVFLMDEEPHMAWLNSRGLQECGIDKNTEAPDGGIICRDEKEIPGCFLKMRLRLRQSMLLNLIKNSKETYRRLY